MNVHPKLNLNVPTFYVDGTEQTKIQDVDIAPAYDERHQPEWKVEPIPPVTFTIETPEWFKEKLETEWKIDE